MKLVTPFPEKTITQHFGANAVSLYTQGLGLKGHPGTDYGMPWGSQIPSATNAYCYSIILNSNPAFYQCVYTLVDDGEFSYEVSYGHISSTDLKIGAVKQGDIVGRVGNTGSVYAGGNEVTTEEKLAGSRLGSHLHFQVRKLKKTPYATMDISKPHINDGQGLYTSPQGFVYEIIDYTLGYNGCVDPEQFFDDENATIKAEVEVLNQTTDPAVRQSLIALIISQLKKILGFK